LYAALKENDFDKAERCLYWGADVNGFLMWGWSKSNKGNTLLTAAVRYSDVEVVKFLLDKGAEVNKKDGFESTPAGISATRGSLEIIRLLSSFGADFEMRSQEFTPLERAKKIKNEAATDLIREILQNK
jgi:ankyrin repeat protein